jgi:hypothetical protein
LAAPGPRGGPAWYALREMAGVLRGIETASTRPLVPAMVVVAAVVCFAAPQRARAAVIYELSPAASVGATSNVQSLSNGTASVFSTISTSAVLRSEWPTARHTLAARLGLTHYFAEGARDTISGGLTGTSAFELTPALGLSLGANGMVSRAATLDSAALAGQATVPGSPMYVATSASQGLTYLATTRLRLSQGLGVSRVDYLTSSFQSAATGRASTAVSAQVGASYAWTRDSASFGLSGIEQFTEAGVDPFGNFVPAGETLFGQAVLGWRRELSLVWSAELQGGVGVMQPPSGRVLTLPVAIATVGYRHLPWYATLTAQHTVVPNLFLGVATINDQASLSLTLPLEPGERYVLSGFGTYGRARPADTGDPVVGAYSYNLITVGSTLSVRFRDLPLFGSATYTLLSQQGTSSTGGALDVVRHTLMLNITAAFTWGPGTPPPGAGLI